MRLQFLGGTDTVTGSKHLVEANGTRVLRDCGLFQGRRSESRERNSRFAFDPQTVHGLVLSHAHIDHCGNIPSLVRHGYRGPIHATTATAALCDIMLHDAARIQEQDAAYLNQKHGRENEPPIEPLYTTEDADRAMTLFRGYHYGDDVPVGEGINVRFIEAGHILGAALTVFTVSESGRTVRVGYAFDLGRKNLPLIRDPEYMADIDVMVIESTYGDRMHSDARSASGKLGEIIRRTTKRGGKVIIPSFALERAQEVLFHIAELVADGEIEQPEVFVDSPMASAVTKVFARSKPYLDEEYAELRAQIGRVMMPSWVRFVGSVEESKALNRRKKPCIVISASGMCEHGRILHHLKHGIEDAATTIVIVGYQAAHTLGRRLVEGETRVRIFGDWYERKAEVEVLNAFSAHADRDDLVDYVTRVRPKRTFLVHGEPDQRAALARHLGDRGIEDVHIPHEGDVVEL